MSENFGELIQLLEEAALEAGQIALSFFKKSPEVWMKGGTSPVSEADFAVDTFLKKTLLNAAPKFGWLSEETEDNSDRLSKEFAFIVDPIDGTRGFIAGSDDWTISIAIVQRDRTTQGVWQPVVVVLHNPSRAELFSAEYQGGSFLNGTPLSGLSQKTSLDGAKISLSHNEILAKQLLRRNSEVQPSISSLAYRIVCVADGRLDGMIAKPNAQDWDIAAADLILTEAGGSLFDHDNGSIHYNKPATGHGSLIAANASLSQTLADELALE